MPIKQIFQRIPEYPTEISEMVGGLTAHAYYPTSNDFANPTEIIHTDKFKRSFLLDVTRSRLNLASRLQQPLPGHEELYSNLKSAQTENAQMVSKVNSTVSIHDQVITIFIAGLIADENKKAQEIREAWRSSEYLKWVSLNAQRIPDFFIATSKVLPLSTKHINPIYWPDVAVNWLLTPVEGLLKAIGSGLTKLSGVRALWKRGSEIIRYADFYQNPSVIPPSNDPNDRTSISRSMPRKWQDISNSEKVGRVFEVIWKVILLGEILTALPKWIWNKTKDKLPAPLSVILTIIGGLLGVIPWLVALVWVPVMWCAGQIVFQVSNLISYTCQFVSAVCELTAFVAACLTSFIWAPIAHFIFGKSPKELISAFNPIEALWQAVYNAVLLIPSLCVLALALLPGGQIAIPVLTPLLAPLGGAAPAIAPIWAQCLTMAAISAPIAQLTAGILSGIPRWAVDAEKPTAESDQVATIIDSSTKRNSVSENRDDSDVSAAAKPTPPLKKQSSHATVTQHRPADGAPNALPGAVDTSGTHPSPGASPFSGKAVPSLSLSTSSAPAPGGRDRGDSVPPPPPPVPADGEADGSAAGKAMPAAAGSSTTAANSAGAATPHKLTVNSFKHRAPQHGGTLFGHSEFANMTLTTPKAGASPTIATVAEEAAAPPPPATPAFGARPAAAERTD